MPNLLRHTYYRFIGTPLFQRRDSNLDHSYPKNLDKSTTIKDHIPKNKVAPTAPQTSTQVTN
jgi:hypothetical protein